MKEIKKSWKKSFSHFSLMKPFRFFFLFAEGCEGWRASDLWGERIEKIRSLTKQKTAEYLLDIKVNEVI